MKTGRPKSKNPRTTVKQIRWKETEWKAVELLAENAGTCPSDYIRAMTLGPLYGE